MMRMIVMKIVMKIRFLEGGGGFTKWFGDNLYKKKNGLKQFFTLLFFFFFLQFE